MALPKNIRPEYNLTLPSNGKKIKYQPFSVREEKILVLAAESQNPEEISNGVLNVLQNCIVSPNNIDVGDLALFDIEYLFLKARAKSIGEKVSVRITDPNDETYSVDHEIQIDKINVEKNKDHTDKIDIGGNTLVQMRYPDISFFNDGVNIQNVNASLELVSRCVKAVVVEEEVYNRTDMGEEELQEWLESLTSSQFQSIVKFFETMPKLRHKITLKNKNTEKNFTIVLEGLADFF